MKKTLITIFVAFFIGGILATLTIFKFEKNLKINPLNENYITAFQVGIYKNLANAEVVAKEYPSAVSIKDGDYYRVYIGVASNTTTEKILKDYYNLKEISIYSKKINVTKTFMEELNKYEILLEKTDQSVIDSINQEIMKRLPGETL